MAYTEALRRLLEESDDAHRAMKPDMTQAHITHVEAKPAKKSRLLYAMDSLDGLELSGVGTMEMSDRVLFEGKSTVCMCAPAQVHVAHGSLGASKIYGDTYVECTFPCEDWTEYNRLTLWIYPDLPTYDNVYFLLNMINDRPEDRQRSELLADTRILQLRHGEWNRVVWEIPNTHRDRMVGLRLRCTVDGRQTGSDLWKHFYFGPIHLEEAETDYYEGWSLGERIAFCHTGYQPEAVKCAYTQQAQAKTFDILDAQTGKTVFSSAVQPVNAPLGEFFAMDFSPLSVPGQYRLRVDERETGVFTIGEEAYASPVWKAMNFFYQERCGCALPGTHRVCHLDALCRHPDGRMISANGGWHDAGDLSQGLCNTSESAFAMLDLAQRVKDSDPRLYRRLMEEARWGIDWCLKTRFGDGYRARWIRIGTWTGNLLGDMDDLILEAESDPFENFCGAAAEAAAARMFRESDPEFAECCLRCAEADFRAACEKMDRDAPAALQTIGEGAVAAGELYRAAGKTEFLDLGAKLLRRVLACQQQTLPDWETPIRGFFYESEARCRPLNYPHRAHEQSVLMGLSLFYRIAPEHPDAAAWREGMQLYAEYIRTIVAYTQPYGLLPGGVYRLETEGRAAQELNPQIREGIRLSDEFYLRIMPVAYDYRGFHGPLLSKAKAVSTVARALNDTELEKIVWRQLEWVLGLNPFAQSTMYGEGYNFPELFVMFSHQIVGAVPVGIWTDGDHDLPYFPHMNNATYKEVWVHPTSRFLWVLADVYGTSRKALHGQEEENTSGAAQNALLCEREARRCGSDVHGKHLPCHADCFVVHPDGRRAFVMGGWHEEDGSSHSLYGTAAAAKELMQQAAAVKETDGKLYARLLEEARIGLEWMQTTRFGDGFRCVDITIDGATNGIIGDEDDVNAPAYNDPCANFCAAAVSAMAARVYAEEDPIFALNCRKCAEEDFRFAYLYMNVRFMTYEIREVVPEGKMYAKALLAAAELFRTTGEKDYSEKAARFAKKLIECRNDAGAFCETREGNAADDAGEDAASGLEQLLEDVKEHPERETWQKALDAYREYRKAEK